MDNESEVNIDNSLPPDIPKPFPRITWPIILGIFLILLTLGASGLFLQQYLSRKKQIITPVPTPTLVSQPTLSPTPINYQVVTPNTTLTANWKTYQDSKFLIKYPNDWTVEASIFYDQNKKKVGEFSPGHLTLKSLVTCDDYFYRSEKGGPALEASETRVTFGEAIPMSNDDRNEPIEKKSVIINNTLWNYILIKAMYEGGREDPGGIFYPFHYCTQRDNRLFLISLYEFSLPSTRQAIFHQILSTFKFLDSSKPTASVSLGCTNNTMCPTGYFCDYGFNCAEAPGPGCTKIYSGSQRCIKKCTTLNSTSECQENTKCQQVYVSSGSDVVVGQLGCKEIIFIEGNTKQ